MLSSTMKELESLYARQFEKNYGQKPKLSRDFLQKATYRVVVEFVPVQVQKVD